LSKPFDATAKHLLAADPAAWLSFASLVPDGPMTLLDTDLATVSAAADGVIRVDGPVPWLVHLEFQAGSDSHLPWRCLRYNVLLAERHRAPTATLLILLRPEADSAHFTGTWEIRLPDGRPIVDFRYFVIRVWEKSANEILGGALALLPLVPLADLEHSELPAFVTRMADRIDAEATTEVPEEIWTSTFILMGLRYSAEQTEAVLKGVLTMKESVTLHAVLEQGRAEGRAEGQEIGRRKEAVDLLLKLGRKWLGPPDPRTVASIEGIAEIERIEQLLENVPDVASWDELIPASDGAGSSTNH
jgi:predicted transposase YdaD